MPVHPQESSKLHQRTKWVIKAYLSGKAHSDIVKSLSRVWLFATPWTVCSLPGFSVHGILQARILEWVTISFSRASSRPRDRTQVSHIGGRRFNLWATREALWITYGAFILGFLGPITLLCLALSPYLVYLQSLPCLCVHLLAKMNSSKDAYG